MRNEIPILKISSYTPKYEDVGLFLNGSHFHGGIETVAVWLHGILVLESNSFHLATESRWLETLNLVAVSESNQLPLIARIMGNRIPIQNHSKEETLNDGRKVRFLPFSFNLRDVLGRGLYNDNYYVHISARQYCSKPIRILRDNKNLSGFLENLETAKPECKAVDQLIKAYDNYSKGNLSEAVESFEKALENEEIRTDIDRPNFQNAAYCAGQQVLKTEAAIAKQFLDKATNWMSEDLKLRNVNLIEIQTQLLSESEPTQISKLENKRLQLLQDMGF